MLLNLAGKRHTGAEVRQRGSGFSANMEVNVMLFHPLISDCLLINLLNQSLHELSAKPWADLPSANLPGVLRTITVQ